MASFPNSIRTFATHVDETDAVMAAHMNEVQGEIVATQTALGTQPQGSATTVGERFEKASENVATFRYPGPLVVQNSIQVWPIPLPIRFVEWFAYVAVAPVGQAINLRLKTNAGNLDAGGSIAAGGNGYMAARALGFGSGSGSLGTVPLLHLDITQVGTDNPGWDLVVQVRWYRPSDVGNP